MFDIGWSEIAIITTVAIIVIGPKDLPKVLRTVGQWIGKAKAMAREFQSSVDEVIRETELDEVTKQINQASNLDIKEQVNKAIDPTGELEDAFKVDMPEDKKDDEDDTVEDFDGLGHEGEEEAVTPEVRPEEESALAAAEKVPVASPATSPAKDS